MHYSKFITITAILVSSNIYSNNENDDYWLQGLAYTDFFESNARGMQNSADYNLQWKIQSTLDGTFPFNDIKDVSIVVANGTVYVSGVVATPEIHDRLKGILLQMTDISHLDDRVVIGRPTR